MRSKDLMSAKLGGVSGVGIYHLLCAAFGQCVTIAQIVHFNVSNIVTILLVDLLVKSAVAGWLRRRLRCACAGTGTATLRQALARHITMVARIYIQLG